MVGGILMCALIQLTCWFILSVQSHALDEQVREVTKTVRSQYPRIPAGECPLWDRIRNGECEEEYRD